MDVIDSDEYNEKYYKYKNKYLSLKKKMSGGNSFCAAKMSIPQNSEICKVHASNWKDCLFSPETNKKCYYHSDFFSMDEVIKTNKYSPFAWSPDVLIKFMDHVQNLINTNSMDKLVYSRYESIPELIDFLYDQDTINKIKILIKENRITGEKLINIIIKVDLLNKSTRINNEKYIEAYDKLEKDLSLFLPDYVLKHINKDISYLKSIILILFSQLAFITFDKKNYLPKIRYDNYTPYWLKTIGWYFNNKSPNMCIITDTIEITPAHIDNFNKYKSYDFDSQEYDENISNIRNFVSNDVKLIFISINLLAEKRINITKFNKSKEMYNTSHANILVLNTDDKTVERFEPHGASTTLYEMHYIDEYIKYIFSMAGIDINFQPTSLACPNIFGDAPSEGIQTFEVEEERENRMMNMCASWTYAYLVKKLTSPDKNLDKIQKEMMGSVTGVARSTEEYKELQKLLYKNINDLMDNILYVSELKPFYEEIYPMPPQKEEQYDDMLRDIEGNRMKNILFDSSFVNTFLSYNKYVGGDDDELMILFDKMYGNIVTYLQMQSRTWRRDVFYIDVIETLLKLSDKMTNRLERMMQIIISKKDQYFQKILTGKIDQNAKNLNGLQSKINLLNGKNLFFKSLQ